MGKYNEVPRESVVVAAKAELCVSSASGEGGDLIFPVVHDERKRGAWPRQERPLALPDRSPILLAVAPVLVRTDASDYFCSRAPFVLSLSSMGFAGQISP